MALIHTQVVAISILSISIETEFLDKIQMHGIGTPLSSPFFGPMTHEESKASVHQEYLMPRIVHFKILYILLWRGGDTLADENEIAKTKVGNQLQLVQDVQWNVVAKGDVFRRRIHPMR